MMVQDNGRATAYRLPKHEKREAQASMTEGPRVYRPPYVTSPQPMRILAGTHMLIFLFFSPSAPSVDVDATTQKF